jgi:hypothetical protein
MERNQIISEFLNLSKVLNQGNKLANEKTTLCFQIEPQSKFEYRLLLSKVGNPDNRKIEICRRSRKGHWERSGFTAFKMFEEFCAYYLNQMELNSVAGGINRVESDEEFLNDAAASLQNEFNSLLINYVP